MNPGKLLTLLRSRIESSRVSSQMPLTAYNPAAATEVPAIASLQVTPSPSLPPSPPPQATSEVVPIIVTLFAVCLLSGCIFACFMDIRRWVFCNGGGDSDPYSSRRGGQRSNVPDAIVTLPHNRHRAKSQHTTPLSSSLGSDEYQLLEIVPITPQDPGMFDLASFLVHAPAVAALLNNHSSSSSQQQQQQPVQISMMVPTSLPVVEVGRFFGLISHDLLAATDEARLVQNEVEKLLDGAVFLDSENVVTVPGLVEVVKSLRRTNGRVVVLLTRQTFFLPWVLAELYAAILNSVPIVLIEIDNKSFGREETLAFLQRLDTKMPAQDVATLRSAFPDLDLVDMAFRLSTVLPRIDIAGLNVTTSESMLIAMVDNFKRHVLQAKAVHPHISRAQFLAMREVSDLV
jgi:hypothetical protein